jgi:hypothetical protein
VHERDYGKLTSLPGLDLLQSEASGSVSRIGGSCDWDRLLSTRPVSVCKQC